MTSAAALCALARFVLITADANRLATFYEDAFGCRGQGSKRVSGSAFERRMGVSGGALQLTLTLGEQWIELLQFEHPGRPYSSAQSVSALDFQHLAIVVGDMSRAYQHLESVRGWSPISRDGPVQLPPRSGGVTAFKFRDPEGHPLEFLAFPASRTPPPWDTRSSEPCLGIDHSAIGVLDTSDSVAFYQSLGFVVKSRSLNVGSEQERLDDVNNVQVEVTSLQLEQSTPHLELLCYRQASPNTDVCCAAADVAATRLVLEAETAPSVEALRDPDGHRLVIVAPSNRASEPGASRAAL